MRPVFRIVAITLFISCALLRPLGALGNWEIVDCVTSEISNETKPGSALLRLKEYIDSRKNIVSAHQLEMTPQGARLKVGVLERDQKRFIGLYTRAVNEGSLREIDMGPVVGPKVFIMLNHMMWNAPKTRANVTIKGTFKQNVFETAQEEQAAGLVSRAETNDPFAWTEQEVKDYNTAVQELGLSRCRSNRCAIEIRISNGSAAILLTADGKPI